MLITPTTFTGHSANENAVVAFGVILFLLSVSFTLKNELQNKKPRLNQNEITTHYSESIIAKYEDYTYLLYQTPKNWWSCYIKIPPTHPLYTIDNISQIPLTVHGGIKFLKYINHEDKDLYPQKFPQGKWIGFDYGDSKDLYFGVSNIDAPSIHPLYSMNDAEKDTIAVIEQMKKIDI